MLAFTAFSTCARVTRNGAGDSDRAHMHSFNDFMIKQRAGWDVV